MRRAFRAGTWTASSSGAASTSGRASCTTACGTNPLGPQHDNRREDQGPRSGPLVRPQDLGKRLVQLRSGVDPARGPKASLPTIEEVEAELRTRIRPAIQRDCRLSLPSFLAGTSKESGSGCPRPVLALGALCRRVWLSPPSGTNASPPRRWRSRKSAARPQR